MGPSQTKCTRQFKYHFYGGQREPYKLWGNYNRLFVFHLLSTFHVKLIFIVFLSFSSFPTSLCPSLKPQALKSSPRPAISPSSNDPLKSQIRCISTPFHILLPLWRFVGLCSSVSVRGERGGETTHTSRDLAVI